ncbi:hypothetical protein AB0J55_38225 [Amycolatopsis sp. NPDC049688]|uniref:hypothetical protein n=1 Tax=Amycolatopsis sp. NPDC049688 TaxID=3154733 RepID=UPI003436AEC3
MDLTVDGPEVGVEVVEAMERGLARMGRPDAEVLVTSDLQAAVRRLDTSVPAYTTQRGGGEVAGRTVITPEVSVIVLSDQYLRKSSPHDIERILAHEAGHLVLGESGEEVGSERLSVKPGWRWKLRYIGGTALEEYRIERAMYDLGYGSSEMAESDSVSSSLHVLNCRVFEAMADPRSHADTVYFEAMILAALSDFAKVLAYCGALSLSGRGRDYPRRELNHFGQANWDDFVGTHWGERLDFFETIPDVRQAGISRFETNVWLQAANLEQELLKRIGFIFQGPPDGGNYYFTRRQDDQVVESRLSRASEEAMVREA